MYPNWDARAPLPPAGLYGGYTQGRPIGGSQFRALTMSTKRKDLEEVACPEDPEVVAEMEILSFPCHVSDYTRFECSFPCHVSDYTRFECSFPCHVSDYTRFECSFPTL